MTGPDAAITGPVIGVGRDGLGLADRLAGLRWNTTPAAEPVIGAPAGAPAAWRFSDSVRKQVNNHLAALGTPGRRRLTASPAAQRPRRRDAPPLRRASAVDRHRSGRVEALWCRRGVRRDLGVP